MENRHVVPEGAPVRAISPVLSRRITDLDELTAIFEDLDVEYVALRNPDRGQIRFSRIDLGDGGALAISDMESPHLTHAHVHAGFFHLGIVLGLPDPMTWNGLAVDPHGGIILRPGADLQVAAPGRSVVAALALPAARLEAAIRALGGAELAFPESGRVLRFDPATHGALAEILLRAGAVAAATPEAFDAPEVRRALCDSILSLVARAVEGLPRRAPERERTMQSHARLVAAAEGYVRDRLGTPIYVTDLCTATGASERTLRSAFRNVYGVGPNRHLKLCRLNAVRRELRGGAPGTRVSAVAQRNGFWDLGRFAGDYRALFGEPPSQTLRDAGVAPAA
jgi:AraC-like DNA-binding protein